MCNWIATNKQLPDSKRTVLLWSRMGEKPLDSGYWDGTHWRGRRLDGKEIAWQSSRNCIACWADIQRPQFPLTPKDETPPQA